MNNKRKYSSLLLNESLLENDLKWLVGETVYIDMHKTKLGKERDHVVLAIPVNDQAPADDLATFIENSVNKFEDVEVSPATDTKGRYLVYVEIARGPDTYKVINGILNDTSRLSGIEQWKFVTMKSAEMDFNEENFIAHVVTDPIEYDRLHPEEDKEDAENKNDTTETATESIKQRLEFLLKY